MKSINLDEPTNFGKSINPMEGGGFIELATKADILRYALPIMRKFYEDYAGDDVEQFFLDYCEALVNEKGDTVP